MVTRKYYTYICLFIALAAPVLLSIFSPKFNADNITNTVIKEFLMWVIFAVLVILAKYGEREPIKFSANGASALKTTGLSILIMICLIAIGIVYRVGYHMITKGPPPHEAIMDKFLKYPAWLKLMMVIRAGIMEETFFRAYGISRIQQLTKNKYLAFIIPLLLFATGHYSYGTFNHVFGAFFLGLVLTISYLKTRNLWANMIGHSLFDGLALLIP